MTDLHSFNNNWLVHLFETINEFLAGHILNINPFHVVFKFVKFTKSIHIIQSNPSTFVTQFWNKNSENIKHNEWGTHTPFLLLTEDVRVSNRTQKKSLWIGKKFADFQTIFNTHCTWSCFSFHFSNPFTWTVRQFWLVCHVLDLQFVLNKLIENV